MTDLSLDKIKNMLGAHNDGVYRLEARENLGEIIGWLINTIEAPEMDEARAVSAMVKAAPWLRFGKMAAMQAAFRALQAIAEVKAKP